MRYCDLLTTLNLHFYFLPCLDHMQISKLMSSCIHYHLWPFLSNLLAPMSSRMLSTEKMQKSKRKKSPTANNDWQCRPIIKHYSSYNVSTIPWGEAGIEAKLKQTRTKLNSPGPVPGYVRAVSVGAPHLSGARFCSE